MTVDFGAVEDCVRRFRQQLQEEREELEQEEEEVQRLTSALYQQFSERSVPGHLNALFVGEEEKEFFPFQEDEDRRRRLAQERREEYNAFLRRKEEAEQLVHKRLPEVVTPRSILESVNYEKVLAKRKAEEAEFRNLNRAEPALDKHASIPTSPVRKYPQEDNKSSHMISNGAEYHYTNNSSARRENFTSRPDSSSKRILHPVNGSHMISNGSEYHHTNNSSAKRENFTSRPDSSGKKISHPIIGNPSIPNGAESYHTHKSAENRENDTGQPESSHRRMSNPVIGFINGQRRGGGGEPLRDSSGNIRTTRGYVDFPTEQDSTLKHKQVSYREELRRQIEEKRALEAERKRRLAEEDAAIVRRSEEQRLRMQKEYEEELLRTQRKTEQRDRDRLRQLEDFQMREAALRQKRAPPPETRVEPPTVQEVEEGRKSPPIPAVRSKTILNNTPPQPILTEVKPENVFSSLSEIRRSLMQQQPPKDFKNSYEVMNRRTVLEDEDDVE